MTFGVRIADLIIEKGISYAELAVALGWTVPQVQQIENYVISKRDIEIIAETLNTDPDELMMLKGHIPDWIKDKMMAHPMAFILMAQQEDNVLDHLWAKSLWILREDET